MVALVVLVALAQASRAGDCPPVQAVGPRAATGEPPAGRPGAEPIELSSDGASVDGDGNSHLNGNVSVVQGDRRLLSDGATYDAATKTVTAAGEVSYQDARVKLRGDRGGFQEGGSGSFEHGDFQLVQRSARGHAEAISVAPNGEIRLDGVSFTSCPASRPDWQIRAAAIDIDQHADQGVGRDVRLEFKGVPILYSPWLSFPVSDARKSGFLFPTPEQSSRSGWALSTPYYFNLAPNYDATLSPGYMSKRGASIEGEFRYLTETSRGSLAANWLPHDEAAHADRSYVRLRDLSDFTPRLRLDVTASAISDSHYFEDFGRGPEGTSVTFLPRSARLTYYEENWRAIGIVEQFQTIDQSLATTDRPYTRLPELLFNGRWRLPARLETALDAQAVYFTREDSVTGARVTGSPTLRYVWRTPGAFLIPSVGYVATGYSLSYPTVVGGAAAAFGQSTSPSVTAPQASVDTGLVFERLGHNHLTTLEPRLLYSYVPYRDQRNLPVFDTALPDLNLVQLFRTQRYVGGDRLADANQIAAGVTSRLIETASGQELLTATLGDIHYFARPRVTLPGENPVDTHTSDAVAQVMVHAYKNWNVELGEQWSPQTSNSQRTEATLQYRASGTKVANLSYRYRRDLLQQVDGNFAWPITDSWNVVGREVYSLKDKTSIDTLVGIQYVSCCWKVRLIGRRDIVSRPTDLTENAGRRDTSIALELELNGLATVGSSANSFLKTAIRGYSPVVAGNPLAD
jgi:LPS-assembly protein